MTLGVIGGSGLYDIEGLENVEERHLKTAFGDPSDAYMCGKLGGREVSFLPRHARGHRILPSEINHRANIMGFKMLGVERIISVSAVGSLSEQIRPRDIVLPDQYFDRTKASLSHTFFGNGIVAHVSFAEPACGELREVIARSARKVLEKSDLDPEPRVTPAGVYVNMEGPAFSTKAESFFHREMHFDVVGMTSLAETKLCREAEICYQAMAMVSDYDCWHETEDIVSIEMIVQHLIANTALAKRILMEIVKELPEERNCSCKDALKNAIITDPSVIPESAKQSLAPIVGKYL